MFSTESDIIQQYVERCKDTESKGGKERLELNAIML